MAEIIYDMWACGMMPNPELFQRVKKDLIALGVDWDRSTIVSRPSVKDEYMRQGYNLVRVVTDEPSNGPEWIEAELPIDELSKTHTVRIETPQGLALIRGLHVPDGRWV